MPPRLRMSAGKKAMIGFGVLNGGMTFYSRRSEHPEESKLTSAGYAAAETALYAMFPGIAFAKDAFGIAQSIGEAGAFNRNAAQAKKAGMMQQGASWQYQDTMQAATMRQRGLEAIQNSRLNARSALGGEARSMHRGAL